MNLKTWISNIQSYDRDAFAYKFGAVAEVDNLWGEFRCTYTYENELVGGYIQTHRDGLANFKLLHVFSKFRGRNYGRMLVNDAFYTARQYGCKYWKCTSELFALRFYEKLGFKSIGLTRDYPSYLILGKILPAGIELDYTMDDFMLQLINKKYPLQPNNI